MPLSEQEVKSLLERAESYIESDKLEQALECYNLIIENAPPHSFYFIRRAAIKYRLAVIFYYDPPLVHSVIEDMNKAIELDPDKGEYYLMRGDYLLRDCEFRVLDVLPKKDRLEVIAKDYYSCIRRDPTNPRVWLKLIGLWLVLHDWDRAIGIYGESKPFINDKKDRLIRSWLGCLALALAGESMEEEDIKPLYDQTVWFADDFLTSMIVWLINFLKFEQEAAGKNRGNIIEITELFIDHCDSWESKACYFSIFRRYEKALKAYDQLLELNPKADKVCYEKFLLLFKYLNRYEEALGAINKAIELNPSKDIYWKQKGTVLEKLNRYKEALEIYDKDECRLTDATGSHIKGRILYKLNRYEDALKAFEKTIELNPDNAMAWYTKACIIYSLKDDKKNALPNLSKAIELDPKYKEDAKQNEDFRNLWEDEDFKRIVG